jgi:quercetin dioxygenase-like cupin family protein
MMNHCDLNALLASALPRSATILRENGLRCLMLHLNAGEEIPSHRARGAITVHCLRGEVRFCAGEEEFLLRAGLLISLSQDSPHSLSALQESVLLVTMSEPVQP